MEKINMSAEEVIFCLSINIDWLYDTAMYYAVKELRNIEHLFKSNYIKKTANAIEKNRLDYDKWFCKYFDNESRYYQAEINEYLDDKIMPEIGRFADVINAELQGKKYSREISNIEAYRCIAATADVLIESYIKAFEGIDAIETIRYMSFKKAENLIGMALGYIGDTIGKDCARVNLNSTNVLNGFASLRDKILDIESFTEILKRINNGKHN